MARFFVFLVVTGSMSMMMYSTKPTQSDYLEELQRRADVIASIQNPVFTQLRGSNPLDEMVTAQAPVNLLEQTRHDDYFVLSVFTTDYNTPGYGRRSVRTIGAFSTFVAFKVR